MYNSMDYGLCSQKYMCIDAYTQYHLPSAEVVKLSKDVHL